MKIIAIIILIVLVAGYLVFKYVPFEKLVPEQVIDQVSTTGMSQNQAVENVKSRPEVQDYLKRVPNGRVEVDNKSEGEYKVHVYEIKDGHTATFNWYYVSIKSGEVRPEFEFEIEEEESSAPKGTVTGKLCYPSEYLPKGLIEAKRPSDSSIFAIDYPGSENGGKNTYSIDLEEGEYYLRYAISPQFLGYKTTVCPTGQEETCGDTKPRELVKISVKPGQTITGYDLCDFYYKDSNAPKF